MARLRTPRGQLRRPCRIGGTPAATLNRGLTPGRSSVTSACPACSSPKTRLLAHSTFEENRIKGVTYSFLVTKRVGLNPGAATHSFRGSVTGACKSKCLGPKLLHAGRVADFPDFLASRDFRKFAASIPGSREFPGFFIKYQTSLFVL